MVIELDSQLLNALNEAAIKRGTTPEKLASFLLRLALEQPTPPMDHKSWVKVLRSIPVECGLSLPDEAITSESMYEQ